VPERSRSPTSRTFGFRLFPAGERSLGLLARRARRDPAWDSLNWISAGDVEQFARRHGLGLHFRSGEPAVLDRLRHDAAFARRQRVPIVAALRCLGASGLTRLLTRLPPAWLTPMTFDVKRFD
jgi:hypothetical protein